MSTLPSITLRPGSASQRQAEPTLTLRRQTTAASLRQRQTGAKIVEQLNGALKGFVVKMAPQFQKLQELGGAQSQNPEAKQALVIIKKHMTASLGNIKKALKNGNIQALIKEGTPEQVRTVSNSIKGSTFKALKNNVESLISELRPDIELNPVDQLARSNFGDASQETKGSDSPPDTERSLHRGRIDRSDSDDSSGSAGSAKSVAPKKPRSEEQVDPQAVKDIDIYVRTLGRDKDATPIIESMNKLSKGIMEAQTNGQDAIAKDLSVKLADKTLECLKLFNSQMSDLLKINSITHVMLQRITASINKKEEAHRAAISVQTLIHKDIDETKMKEISTQAVLIQQNVAAIRAKLPS